MTLPICVVHSKSLAVQRVDNDFGESGSFFVIGNPKGEHLCEKVLQKHSISTHRWRCKVPHQQRRNIFLVRSTTNPIWWPVIIDASLTSVL